MANILLVDDHQVFMDSLKFMVESLSDHLIVNKITNAKDTYKYLVTDHENVDIILLDVRLPDENGINILKNIKQNYPQSKVVLFSQFHNDEYVCGAWLNAADGYIIKNVTSNDLIEAINKVLSGERFFCPESKNVINKYERNEKLKLNLSDREKEVLKCIALGNSAKQVADILCISVNTVQFHKKILKSKLNIKNSMEFVKHAYTIGLI